MPLKEPVLAHRVLPADKAKGRRTATVFTVYGGLNYIKGNDAPHFSLTSWSHRKGFPNQCQTGGANHDEIVRLFPKYADIARLHLSDINGVPTHAADNGWYWLAGALGGLGERYHGGHENGKTPDECLQIFADLVRISSLDAEKLRLQILHSVERQAEFKRWIEAQKPRWKIEANLCIRAHNLTVYGDTQYPGRKVHTEDLPPVTPVPDRAVELTAWRA